MITSLLITVVLFQGKIVSAPPLYEPIPQFENALPKDIKVTLTAPFAFSQETPPQIACVRQDSTNQRTEIVVTDIAGTPPKTLLSTPKTEYATLQWSPNNRYLAVVEQAKQPQLKVIEVATATCFALGTIPTKSVYWTADSRSLHYWGEHSAPIGETPQWRLNRISAPWSSPTRLPLPHFYQNSLQPPTPSSGVLLPQGDTMATWVLEKEREGGGQLWLVFEDLKHGNKKRIAWRKFEGAGDFYAHRIEFQWSGDQQWLYMVYQRGEASRPYHYIYERATNKITGLNPALLTSLNVGTRLLLPVRQWVQIRGTQFLCLPHEVTSGSPLRDRDGNLRWSLYNPQTQQFTAVAGCPPEIGTYIANSSGKYLLFHNEQTSRLTLYKMSLKYLLPSPTRKT
jgi:hypothetical protein